MKGNGSAVDLSRRALSLKISSTVAVAQRAAAMKAAGESVLDFSVGEPDQPTPSHIKDAAVAALSLDRTRYTPAAGIRELRAAIAMRYRQDFNVTFEPAEVAVTMGGKQALYLVCNALLDRGDEVVIPTPHWPTFSEAVRLAGGRPVVAQTREKDGFRVTARLIAKARSRRGPRPCSSTAPATRRAPSSRTPSCWPSRRWRSGRSSRSSTTTRTPA